MSKSNVRKKTEEERIATHMEIARYLVNYGVVGFPTVIIIVCIILDMKGCG